ncbi:MAG: nucleoside recognition domain-containing protein [Oscillospiraceae bacterium]|nr:nucleoside recognition domain-containing protein [Oscillospiraceae bacterium]
MKGLFPLLIFLSLFFGILTENMEAVSRAALESAGQAVALSLTLAGTLCLWSGIMKIADRADLTEKLVRLIAPLLRLLFGRRLTPEASRAMAMNLSANLLGLGNAATPLGLAAMRELKKAAPEPNTATDEMILFTVMNTSSLQLIPTTVAGLRQAAGSAAPMEILPAVWLVSAASLAAAIGMAKLLRRFCP